MTWTSRRLFLLALVLLVSSMAAGFVVALILSLTTHATAIERCPCR